MKKYLKVISMILIFTFLFTLFPLQSFAGDENSFTPNTAQSEVNSKSKIITELTEKREKNVKHFLKEDGTFEAVAYPEAVHYMDENGQWQDIDNTLIENIDDGSKMLENKANNFKVKISQNSKSDKLINIKKDKYELSWSLTDRSRAEKQIDKSTPIESGLAESIADEVQRDGSIKKKELKDVPVECNQKETSNNELSAIIDSKLILPNHISTATFKNIYEYVDLQYKLNPESLKENIILNQKIENPDFCFELKVSNLMPVLMDNSIILYDTLEETPTEVFRIQAPFMTDANGETSYSVKQELEEAGGKYYIYIKPDKAWLDDSCRVYPVTIDPYIRSYGTNDSFISSANPNSNYSSSSIIAVGNYSSLGTCRGYISFILPQLASSDTVIYANMYLRSGSSQAFDQVNIYKVLNSWNASTLTWNNAPQTDPQVINYVKGLDSYIEYYTEITGLAKEWYSTGVNNGIMLKYKNENSVYASFYSYSTYYPFIQIDYTGGAGLEDYWSYHQQNVGSAGTGYVNDCSGNLVFLHEDVSANGNRMPFPIQHIYNSSEKSNDIGFGAGWKLNLSQTTQSLGYPYFSYIDGDGTRHGYIYQYAVNNNFYCKDQSGLNSTMIVYNDGSYLHNMKRIYDKFGQFMQFNTSGVLTQINDGKGNYISLVGNPVNYIFDAAGRGYSLGYSGGHLLSITAPDGKITRFEYLGSQLKKIIYPDLSYSLYDYDAQNNLIAVTNKSGYKVEYEYFTTAPYRIKKWTEKNVNGTTGQQIEIAYNNNTSIFTDLSGKSSTYTFNKNCNTVNIIDNEGYAQFYKYASGDNVNKLSLESKIQKSVINYIKNHNAELERDWISGSASGSTGTSTYDTNLKYLGNRSLKISKTNTLGAQFYNQQITLERGKAYTFSGYIKTGNISKQNSKGAGLSIEYQDVNGITQTVNSEYINGTNEWKRISVNFSLPSNALSAAVTIKACISEETGNAYFDCLQLEVGNIANRYNIIENADMKYGANVPDFWAKNGDCSTEDILTTGSNVPGLDGNCFRLVGDITKTKTISQTLNIPGKKGDIFALGGWAKGASVPIDTSTTRCFKIEVVLTKTDATEQKVSIPFNDFSYNWQYVIDRVIAESDYTNIKINITYGCNENTAFFDGLQLYKEEFGRSFGYDSKGNVTSISDLASQTSQYEYNSTNDATKYSNTAGSTIRCAYDGKHNLTTSSTTENLTTSYTYDTLNNPLTTKVGDSSIYVKSSASYTTDYNFIKTITDPAGKTSTFNYNLQNGILNSFVDPKGKTTSYIYDVLKRLTSVSKTVDGQEVKNEYVYENDYLKNIIHNGFNYTFNYNSLGYNTGVLVGNQPLVTNNYNSTLGRLDSTSYGNGQGVSYEYDNIGRVKNLKYNGQDRFKYEYDASGNIGYYEDILNNTAYRYTYDMANRPVAIKSTQGDSTGMLYDSSSHMDGLIEKYSNGATYQTNYEYDKDNKGRQTYFKRFNLNNSSIEYFPLNGSTGGTNGTIAYQENKFFGRDENAKQVFSSYELDGNFLANPSFETINSQGYITNWQHAGSDWNISHDAIEGNNSFEIANKNLDNGTAIYYQISYPTAGDYTFSAYTKRFGNTTPTIMIRYTLTNNQTVEYLYNENIPESEWQLVSHTFSIPVNTSKIEIRVGATVYNQDCVRFDAVKLLKKSYATPFTTGTKLIYDHGVNKNSGTQALWFKFKEGGGTERNIIVNKSSNGATLKAYTGSDNILKLALTNSSGVLVGVINTNAALSLNTWYYMSLRWQLTGQTLTCYLDLNDTMYTVSTTDFSDFSGAMTGVGCNTEGSGQLNGLLEGYCYSTACLGQTDINNIYQNGRGIIFNVKYDMAGRMSANNINTGSFNYQTSFQYASGVNGSSTYQLSSITNNGSSIGYTYDSNGNIETINQGGQQIKYYYNELNELVREDNQVLNKTITYAYDVGGNFTSKIEYPYTTGTPSNPTKTYTFGYDGTWKDKMTSYDGNAITYDNIGNPLTYNGWTYTWEMGRQLAGISGNGYNINYKYNDSGIRTQKTINGVTTNYHLIGDKVTYQTDGTDSIYYTYDANGKLVSMNLNGQEYYYVYNGQGDVIGLFDVSGAQVVSYTYNTWGKLVSVTGTLASTVGLKNPYRYRGYRYDTETGLYYLQNRYYNPEWGRFINADRITGVQGLLLSHNMFAYCMNNPVMYEDPNGDIIPLIAAAVASAPAWVPYVCLGVAALYSAIVLDSAGLNPFKASADSTSQAPPPSPNNWKDWKKNGGPWWNPFGTVFVATKALQEIYDKWGQKGIDVFCKAVQKGFVGSVGQAGIKTLSSPFVKNGIKYIYEIKVFGDQANYRIYGYLNSAGEYIFDLFDKALH